MKSAAVLTVGLHVPRHVVVIRGVGGMLGRFKNSAFSLTSRLRTDRLTPLVDSSRDEVNNISLGDSRMNRLQSYIRPRVGANSSGGARN